MAFVASFITKILDDSEQYYSSIISASFSKKITQRTTVADGVTDTALVLGDVSTVNALYLESDQALSIRFNSAAGTQWTVTANCPLILTGIGSVTAIYISNASGSTANLKYRAWKT